MSDRKPVICIGIVAFDGLDGQVAQDYMRLMFHLGRRHPEHDFQLAIKWKSEQFRARNAIVKAARQFGADYIWMLDDDHIIDTEREIGATSAYDLPIKLVKHLEENPKIGVVGALYYQRGGDYYPVIMQETPDNERPFFLTQAEISNRMQKVDVTGGGCMMIRTSVFDKIDEPWFAPEHTWGTDIQLCKQVRAIGYEVWCDTSLQIGHLQNEKNVVTRDVVMEKRAGVDRDYAPLVRYRDDVLEYLGITLSEAKDLAGEYDPSEIKEYANLIEYYASRDRAQLARQLIFHHCVGPMEEMKYFHSVVRSDMKAYGAEYGCGSAPVGFEFALRGHKMDFIDVDGSAAYEFTKWRAKKHGIEIGTELKGPYDYVLMLDAIEHIPNWQEVLGRVLGSIKPGGVLITNYFFNRDFSNPEHVSMDHGAVALFLQQQGFESKTRVFWVKRAQQEEAA